MLAITLQLKRQKFDPQNIMTKFKILRKNSDQNYIFLVFFRAASSGKGLELRSSSLRRSFLLFGKTWISKNLGLTIWSKTSAFLCCLFGR